MRSGISRAAGSGFDVCIRADANIPEKSLPRSVASPSVSSAAVDQSLPEASNVPDCPLSAEVTVHGPGTSSFSRTVCSRGVIPPVAAVRDSRASVPVPRLSPPRLSPVGPGFESADRATHSETSPDSR